MMVGASISSTELGSKTVHILVDRADLHWAIAKWNTGESGENAEGEVLRAFLDTFPHIGVDVPHTNLFTEVIMTTRGIVAL